MCNLYYRLSYSIFLLEKLLEMFPNHQIQLMYDVAFVLIKHLQVRTLINLIHMHTYIQGAPHKAVE